MSKADYGIIYSHSANLLGDRPPMDERRQRARWLLANARASLLAIATAWYWGDVEMARKDIYPPWRRSER